MSILARPPIATFLLAATPPDRLMPMSHAAPLSELVSARRAELKLSLRDVWSNGGPAVATLRNIESGKAISFRGETLDKLDQALQWPPGTARQAAGVTPATVATDGPKAHPSPGHPPSYLRLVPEELSDLITWTNHIGTVLKAVTSRSERSLTVDELERLITAHHEQNVWVSVLAGEWFDDLIERDKGDKTRELMRNVLRQVPVEPGAPYEDVRRERRRALGVDR